jgi:monofunctional biosynthetic peptidoglycan transglycosylase
MKHIDFDLIKEKLSGIDYRGLAAQFWIYTKATAKWGAVSLVALMAIGFIMLWSLKWINPSFTAFTLQEDWGDLGKERYSLRQEWVSYEEIPQNIKWAVVASEDQKFWNHQGVDLVAIAEAYQEMESGERVRGASTITQQVAKNLFLSSDKNYVRKGMEAGIAVTIDALWGKERVMEMYLNIAEFGPGIYGIGKASDHFFGKNAKFLKDEESARMAAVLPNPKRMRVEPASPYVKERKVWILKNMMNLSGIAYYEAPKPKTVPDSTQKDSTLLNDISFMERREVSRVGFSIDNSDNKSTNKQDSTSADSTLNNDFKYN